MKRHIIIGDLHGCYEELIALLSHLHTTDDDVVVAVGDIIDRGPDSVKVYDFFRTRPHSVVVMGNHERKHLNQVMHYGQEIVKLQFGSRYTEFLEWASHLPYYYETDEALVVHGGFENGVPLSAQKEEVLCGSTAGEKYLAKQYGTEQYWPGFYTGEKPIVFGHHVVGEQAQVWANKVYGIDTGACHGMRLTALTLPDFQIHSVPAAKDYWEEERYLWQLPVLQAKPWQTFFFKKIEEELAPFQNSPRIEVTDFVQQLNDWVQQLKQLIPSMIQALHQKLATLLVAYSEEAVNPVIHQLFYHSLLFSARKGTLTEQILLQTVNTPEKMIQLADELKVKLPVATTNTFTPNT